MFTTSQKKRCNLTEHFSETNKKIRASKIQKHRPVRQTSTNKLKDKEVESVLPCYVLPKGCARDKTL